MISAQHGNLHKLAQQYKTVADLYQQHRIPVKQRLVFRRTIYGHYPKNGDWHLLRISNILNLPEKLTKSVLTVAVLRLRNIFVNFSHIFSILALLATVQPPFLGLFATSNTYPTHNSRHKKRTECFFTHSARSIITALKVLVWQ